MMAKTESIGVSERTSGELESKGFKRFEITDTLAQPGPKQIYEFSGVIAMQRARQLSVSGIPRIVNQGKKFSVMKKFPVESVKLVRSPNRDYFFQLYYTLREEIAA